MSFMASNNKITPAQLWILTLATVTVITLLIFTGIKLFHKEKSISINNSPSSYNFISDICSISYDSESKIIQTDEKCWDIIGSNFAWYMICNSPKIGDFGRAIEVRLFFAQGKYSHIYAFDIANNKMKYTLDDFSKDIADKRITECLYQYPMKIQKNK